VITVTYDSIGLRQLMEIKMAWIVSIRLDYDRSTCRYASDLTDDEWNLIEGFMPLPKSAQQGKGDVR
jgi:hypothetical protein